MLPFKPKSLEALRLGYREPVETTVYEGAIRSAKTITSLFDWDDYILHCKEKAFLMSGNTLGSLSRNCLEGEYGFLALTGAVPARDFDGSHILRYAGKIIYLMGGHDSASFKKARGLTIGGAYLDEGNLQDRMFVETILGRSFASSWIRNIFTINPDVPRHWFYSDKTIGIDRFGADHVPDIYRRFHFTLDDNPAITEERKACIAAQYTGVFYKRYILGLRVRAEGACYPSFKNNKPGEPGNVLDVLPNNIYMVTIAADIGGNKSATVFHATGWYSVAGRLAIVTIDELYDDRNKNTESVLSSWKAFIERVRAPRLVTDSMGREKFITLPIDRAFCDSAEQLIKKSLDGISGVHVEDSWKAPIIDRIRCADLLYAQGRKNIMRSCPHAIEATESAMWNQKASKDKEERLDDGTTDIDSLDADEYSWEREMSRLLEGVNA